MKKNIVILLGICLLFLCSCNRNIEYPFMHSEDEISCISIAAIEVSDSTNLQIAECKTIHDINGFLQMFRGVKCSTWWGDPIGITEDCYAIKVEYHNGEYELIAWNGKAVYQNNRGLRNYRGYHIFDEEEFNKLVSRSTDGSLCYDK